MLNLRLHNGLRSSDPSPQSSSPLHSHFFFSHFPLSQRNSVGSQQRAAKEGTSIRHPYLRNVQVKHDSCGNSPADHKNACKSKHSARISNFQRHRDRLRASKRVRKNWTAQVFSALSGDPGEGRIYRARLVLASHGSSKVETRHATRLYTQHVLSSDSRAASNAVFSAVSPRLS